jgi:S-adenosyl methyltransferase
VEPRAVSEFDVTVAHPARMYDYYLGGKDNFEADREAADKLLAVVPEARDIARANRGFLVRAVRYLAAEKGIRQFLDIGTGIPTHPGTHEVAQAVAPGAKVVYADNDPIVLAHARAFLASGSEGNCAYVHADLRNPDAILDAARSSLDFTQPVALLMIAVLHFIPDRDAPAALVAAYLDALPGGSYLALSHGTADFHPDKGINTAAVAAYDSASAPLVPRTKPQIEKLFGGLIMEPPGLVQAPLWRPDADPEPGSTEKIGIYAGVARN